MIGRLRSLGAFLTGCVAIVGLLVSVLAVWATDVLFDSTEVSTAVERALAEQEVTDSMASLLTTAAFEAADLESRMEALLPGELAQLVPALVGGVRSSLEQRLADLLATEGARDLVVAVVERSHAALMRLLEGDGFVDGISVTDGEVRLNLLPLVVLGLRELQGLGYLDGIELPRLTAAGDPAEQIAALEATFGRTLPPDLGQLTVYESDSLDDASATVAAAQRMLVLVKRAVAAVIALTLGAVVATVLLARGRRRAVLTLAIASVAVMLVARSIVRKILDEAPVVVVDPGGRAAVSAMLQSLTSGLFVLVTLVLVLAAAVAVVAFLRSEQPLAVRWRGGAGHLRGGAWSVISRHRDATAMVAFGLAVAVIVVGGIGLAQFLVAVVLAAVGAWAWWAPRADGDGDGTDRAGDVGGADDVAVGAGR